MEGVPRHVFSPNQVSLASVELEPVGWTLAETTATTRSWSNESGDLLSLHWFQTPPDIGARLGDLPALRAFFRTMVLKNGGGIVSVDVTEVGGVPAVAAVVKVPQEPRGTTYLASLTLPRRDFSFVVKVQCLETGDVGERESTLYGRFLVGPTFDPARPLAGWEADPYEPARRDRVMRNGSEAEEFDAQFPAHPLTRARRALATLSRTVRLRDEITRAPAFFGPD